MDVKQFSMTRRERIETLRTRDGIFCFHPECGKPFKNLTADIDITEANLDLFDDITFDHWHPRSQGGTWDIANLRMMHKRCNAVKGDTVPNSDGTLPARDKLNAAQRRATRGERPEVCNACNAGRNLGPDEVCIVCDSPAMPLTYPQWAKLHANECPHESVWWCWACMSGVVDRVPAIVYVLGGDELDDT